METRTRKPLTHGQMALAISIVLAGGAIPVYLAISGNPWPCLYILLASWAYRTNRHWLNADWIDVRAAEQVSAIAGSMASSEAELRQIQIARELRAKNLKPSEGQDAT